MSTTALFGKQNVIFFSWGRKLWLCNLHKVIELVRSCAGPEPGVWIRVHAAFPRPQLQEIHGEKIDQTEWVKILRLEKVEAPGWLSRLSVWLRLRSRSYGSWIWALCEAPCWQLRAWSLPQILCLPLSLSPSPAWSLSLSLSLSTK